jgi:C_GCAxxG_C_C family probable redox protein
VGAACGLASSSASSAGTHANTNPDRCCASVSTNHMDDIDRAVQTFQQGFNCAQAVVSVHADRLGLPRAVSLKLAEGFGGGMAGLGKTCGAVTGAMMALGLTYGRTASDDAAAKADTARRVRQLIARFEARHGSSDCRALLGCDIDTPEKLKAARDQGLFDSVCCEMVRSAAELVEQSLAE